MKRVPFTNRQTGDIYLTAVPGIEHDLIWQAERVIHPNAPNDFMATHAGIIGPVAGWLTEAWLNLNGVDSVAAVVADTKYDGLPIELWRTGADAEAIWNATTAYLDKYVPEKYGLLNLFGFEYLAIVKALTGKDVENPINCSEVCSQGMGDYLKMLEQETPWLAWAAAIDIRDLDPLCLRMLLLSHEQK